MFKKTALASAMLAAMTAQIASAQEQNPPAQDGQVEEVVVTGIRGSLTKALDIKRDSPQIVEAIVAEDIGKFPDNNVIESLQRITGVQVTGRGGGEADVISIRGLNDVHTTVNGRDVYTGIGRAIALQDIPASLLSGVTVYKTRTADQVERGIAGSIDVKTNRPFDFSDAKVVLAGRAIYSDQPDEIDPNISALFSNRWELESGGEFGALLNVSYAETHYRDDTITAGAVFPFFNTHPESGFSPYERIPAESPTKVRYWEPGLEMGLPNTPGSTLSIEGADYDYLLMRDAIFGTSYTGLRERPAASLSLQWAPNDELELLGEVFYTGYRNESQNAMWFSNTFEHQEGNIDIPLVYEGTNVVKEHQGWSNGGFQSGDYATGKTDSFLYALGATWTPTDTVKVKSELLFQESEYSNEFFAMRFVRTAYGINVDYNDRDGVPSIKFIDNPATSVNETDMAAVDNWNASTIWDNGGRDLGDSVTFTTDVEWELDTSFIQKIKAGGRYEERNAQQFGRGQDSSTYAGTVSELMTALVEAGASGDGSGLIFTANDYFQGRANIFDSFITANGSYLLANSEAVRTVYDRKTENLVKTLDVTEESAALYATARYALSDSVTGDIGVRYVDYTQTLESWAETGMNTDKYDEGAGEGKADKVLPSLSLNWNINDDLVARFAYTQTLRMPNFTDLNPLQYTQDPLTDVPYGTATGGNPNLKPTESTNYDLSLEWYFAEGSSLYGAVFKREIDGLVIGGRSIITGTNQETGEPQDYVLTSSVNAANGELSGVEVGLVYFPDNLPQVLDGLGIQASYTALDSSQQTPEFDNDDGSITGYVETKMAGVSDSSYSVVLAYDKEVFDARLSYVWREEFYSGNEAAIFANPIQFWSRPEQSLDLQISWDVTDELMLTFDATNLLDDVYQNYYGEGNQNLYNFGSGVYSKTFALGARYSF